MNDLAIPFASIPATSAGIIKQITDAECELLCLEQIDLVTEHVLHGGMYARTVRLPPGVIITGALIKVATILIFNGDADVLIGDTSARISGYGVLAASAFRKQVFVTRSQVELTMIFPTQAKTVEEAEAEFTDEADRLMSRRSTRDVVVITGE